MMSLKVSLGFLCWKTKLDAHNYPLCRSLLIWILILLDLIMPMKWEVSFYFFDLIKWLPVKNYQWFRGTEKLGIKLDLGRKSDFLISVFPDLSSLSPSTPLCGWFVCLIICWELETAVSSSSVTIYQWTEMGKVSECCISQFNSPCY